MMKSGENYLAPTISKQRYKLTDKMLAGRQYCLAEVRLNRYCKQTNKIIMKQPLRAMDICSETGEFTGSIVDAVAALEVKIRSYGYVEVTCDKHGDFWVLPKDHIGENDQRIAYGCPECRDRKKV